ncbi:MAG: glutamate--tRNA ligase, partial [Lentisphaeria bacterium]|nr:glutamate--tRNA ligase [Lentisphaeria bacterium]
RAGLHHDEGPDKPGDCGPYVQSERRELYGKYALELVKKQAAYYCFCEKQEGETQEAGNDPHETCPGHCRDLDPAEAAAKAASGVPFVIRQKIDRTGTSAYDDAVFGHIEIDNDVLDDQILIKQDKMPTYNFANVVDDHLMHITHVVRGAEYLPSTPKYNMLYKAFGWEIPQYVHLPLIMGRDAEGNVAKLSKRHGSVSFENLMQEGYLPEAVINYIALLGWSPKNDREIFSLQELIDTFKVEGLNKAPAIFDYDKLLWMNTEYLKAMTQEEFAAAALPFSGVAGTALEAKWSVLASMLQQRVGKLDEIPAKITFLHELPEYDTELFNNKKSKCNPEIAREILQELRPEFEGLADWTAAAISAILSGCAERRGCKLGLPMWAVRIAVSGMMVTPGGPGEIMEIIGKEEAMRRYDLALEKLNV